ncbi:MAG: isochorismatase family protein, partial [Acidimicrobiaceae bacterium]|nr:isochorismatase family protein [Acidimicrobiaceae bacterium]
MTAVYPWHDAIPPDDTARYLAAGYGDTFSGDEFRAISAGTSPALVVVDMTLAFVDGRWPTGCGDTAWPAVEANARLLDEFRRLGHPVYFTKLYANPGHVPFPGQKGRWKTVGRRPPAEDLPPGDVIVDELAPKPDELVICKSHKPSGFFG